MKIYIDEHKYKVYHYPSAQSFYFEWKPTKKQLEQLLKKIGGDPNDYIEIEKFDFQSEQDYGIKLRERNPIEDKKESRKCQRSDKRKRKQKRLS